MDTYWGVCVCVCEWQNHSVKFFHEGYHKLDANSNNYFIAQLEKFNINLEKLE